MEGVKGRSKNGETEERMNVASRAEVHEIEDEEQEGEKETNDYDRRDRYRYIIYHLPLRHIPQA